MKGLPIPTSLGSWICGVILLPLLFIGYYLYLFGELQAFYLEERAGYPAFYSYSKDPGCGPLEIRVDSPRQIAPFGKRWLYVTIRNNSASPITVTTSLSTTPSLTAWNMPFLFGSSTRDTTAISFSSLQPYATAYGRIPLFSTQEITKAALYVHISGIEDCLVTIAQPPQINRCRYLIHALTEQLLLPPWSNGILAAVGLLIPALLEKESTKISLRLIFQLFLRSLGLALAFIAGVLVVASLIWLPLEKEVGGYWNIAIIILGFIIIPLFAWGSLDLDSLVNWFKEKLLRRKWFWLVTVLGIVLMLIAILLITFFLTQFPLLKPLGYMFIAMGIIMGINMGISKYGDKYGGP